jgi:hypothetical protein
MHKKCQVTGLSILLIGISVLLTGCLDENNNGEETIPGLNSVYPLRVEWEDWDDDGSDDGLLLGFYFRDQSDNIIIFDNVEVFVTAELYTQVNTTPLTGEKDRLVYSNTFTITSSRDVHPLSGAALKIPAEDINIDTETDYYLGIIEVSVSVPQQGEFRLPPDNLVRLYN